MAPARGIPMRWPSCRHHVACGDGAEMAEMVNHLTALFYYGPDAWSDWNSPERSLTQGGSGPGSQSLQGTELAYDITTCQTRLNVSPSSCQVFRR